MHIVFLDFGSLHPADLNLASVRAHQGVELWDDSAPADVAARLQHAEIVVINKLVLGREQFAACPQLKLVCVAATGADNVDLDAARQYGVTVCNIRDYCTPSVVQHVFGLLLALTQHLPMYTARIAAGDWERSDSFCLLEPVILELEGCTLGIVGYGTLGQAVARAGAAFGMHIVASQQPGRTYADPYPPRLPLNELLQESDVVSLHCPLTADTHHLINANSLRRMRRNAVLINTARGGLVDPAALLEALQSGVIAAAGIDVLEQEPPRSGHPLLSARLPNLLVTPHIAWSAREARQRALNEVMQNIEAFIAGRPRNVLAAP